jgi:hypothetical protein
MLKGAVVEYFKVLPQNLPGGTEKKHIIMIRLTYIVKSVIHKNVYSLF